MIKARNIDPAAAARYVDVLNIPVLPANATVSNLAVGPWLFTGREPHAPSVPASTAGFGLLSYARIVDVLIGQTGAGVAGTSVAVNILKNNSTSIWATTPVIALAGGANTQFDTLGVLALPTGATRGVLSATVANILLKKGDVLTLTTTTVGAYTTAPGLWLCVVVDPFPV